MVTSVLMARVSECCVHVASVCLWIGALNIIQLPLLSACAAAARRRDCIVLVMLSFAHLP
jgi:hypothetical protein